MSEAAGKTDAVAIGIRKDGTLMDFFKYNESTLINCGLNIVCAFRVGDRFFQQGGIHICETDGHTMGREISGEFSAVKFKNGIFKFDQMSEREPAAPGGEVIVKCLSCGENILGELVQTKKGPICDLCFDNIGDVTGLLIWDDDAPAPVSDPGGEEN